MIKILVDNEYLLQEQRQLDDFAVDFQNWLVKNCTLNMKIWTYGKDKSRIYEITELLNMFKKQPE